MVRLSEADSASGRGGPLTDVGDLLADRDSDIRQFGKDNGADALFLSDVVIDGGVNGADGNHTDILSLDLRADPPDLVRIHLVTLSGRDVSFRSPELLTDLRYLPPIYLQSPLRIKDRTFKNMPKLVWEADEWRGESAERSTQPDRSDSF